ncbi:DDE-type integrase/transposase/recombinase [Crocosphaera sp. Alani8]|uniref:DDE-type integrase/transposase/recombinase n=1 Tax=Crocosphaera sp. Alani8 TaxID=3038952 RepID=UPI00313EEF20
MQEAFTNFRAFWRVSTVFCCTFAFNRSVCNLERATVLAVIQLTLNNLIEQDHRRVKKIIKAGLGYQSFRTAWKTIRGIEMIQMIRKGQVENVSKGDSVSQKEFIESLFEMAV